MVQKCREGRTDYRGLLSFAAIAVPMTVMLINEFIGDAILDAVIPGIYAGIVVLAADVFAISLRALLLLLGIPLGILFYLIFIYHPARAAHDRRKEVLKRMRVEGLVASRFRRSLRNSSIMGYVKRIAVLMKRKVQENIAWLPCSELLYDARQGVVERDWRHLNMPPLSQGLIVRAGHSGRSRSVLQRECLRNPVSLPPARIFDMMTSSAKGKAALYSERQEDSSSYYTKLTHRQTDVPVITKAREYRRYNRSLSSLVLFDPADVISRFRVALKTYQPDGTSDIVEVSMVELEFSFKWMLNIFSPDGIPLTVLEKDEAIERFFQWSQEHPSDGPTGATRGLDEVRTVHFNAFSDWLSEELASAFHRNLPERLINHTLRYAPLTKARMSAQSLCSANSSTKLSVTREVSVRSIAQSRSTSPSRSRSSSPIPSVSKPYNRVLSATPPRPCETARRTPDKEKGKGQERGQEIETVTDALPRSSSLLISFDDIYSPSPAETPPGTPVINRKPFFTKY